MLIFDKIIVFCRSDGKLKYLQTCEIWHYGKSSIPIFQEFLASIEKKFFGEKNGPQGSNYIKFCSFSDISYLPKILSLKLFSRT